MLKKGRLHSCIGGGGGNAKKIPVQAVWEATLLIQNEALEVFKTFFNFICVLWNLTTYAVFVGKDQT